MDQLVLAQSDLNAYVSTMLPFHRGDVADIVQETNLALLAAQKRYDPSRPFMPWAMVFAKHQVQAYLRDAGRERVLFSSETVDALSEIYADDSVRETAMTDEKLNLLKRLELCREKLKDRDRLMLSLFYDQRKPVRDISRLLNSSEPSIRMTLSNIRKKLGRCVRHFCSLNGNDSAGHPARAIDRVLENSAEDRPPSARLLREAETECRAMSRESLRDVLDDLRIDSLLRGPDLKTVALSRTTASRVWRAVRLAAGLAILLGGIGWAATRLADNRIPEKVEPVAVSSETLPTVNLPAATPSVPTPIVTVMAPTTAVQSVSTPTVVAAVPAAATQPQKEKEEMKVTSKVKATMAALTVAASATVPAASASGAARAVSDGFSLDAMNGGRDTSAQLDLEARDCARAIRWDLNLLSTKPQGGAVIIR